MHLSDEDTPRDRPEASSSKSNTMEPHAIPSNIPRRVASHAKKLSVLRTPAPLTPLSPPPPPVVASPTVSARHMHGVELSSLGSPSQQQQQQHEISLEEVQLDESELAHAMEAASPPPSP